MKINIFSGDLSVISAIKEPLSDTFHRVELQECERATKDDTNIKWWQ